MKAMYGNTGERDNEAIDAHLMQLPEGAVVVNLGCGPNIQNELNNFARAVGKYQYHSRLIFADLNASGIRNRVWAGGPKKVEVVTLNAATATTIQGNYFY